jgi:hypothetical protein
MSYHLFRWISDIINICLLGGSPFMYDIKYIAEEFSSEQKLICTYKNKSAYIFISEDEHIFRRKEIIVVKPTLRINERFVDKPLTVEVRLFNKDSLSYNFVLMLSLYDDKDKHLGTVSNVGRLDGENKQINNYCFKKSKNCAKYKLKVAINCDGENNYYNFELKAPKQG